MLRVLAAFFALVYGQARASPIINGNFEQGDTGFATEYLHTPGDIGATQSYDVVSDPALARPNDPSPVSYGDHTSGSGLMLAANGSLESGALLWGQTVAVEPGVRYKFTAYVSSWYGPPAGELDVLFNGEKAGTISAPSYTGLWVHRWVMWDSGPLTSVDIELRSALGADTGNDLALDDLSLNPAVPEPPAWVSASMAAAVLGAVWVCYRRRQEAAWPG